MFHGSIPALVTPFTNGAIDRDAFVALVERQIAAGASARGPVGTTGETSTLSHDEHREVVRLCVETAGGRVPVIAGCGSNATSEAIELVGFAKTVGADAGLVVCPYYNRPDQSGLFAHFKAINDAVALPVFIYNVPSRTASDIRVETIAELAKLPDIIGTKDATGELGRVARLRELTGDDALIQLSGDDPSAVGFCAMGGAGCISVTANVAPAACAEMMAAVRAGDFETARRIDERLSALHSALFASPSPGPTKYALAKLGLCEPGVRLPLTPPSDAVQAEIDAAMARAGLEV